MNDAERIMQSYRMFLFAINATVVGLGLEPSSDDYNKIFQVVRDVADGKTTVTDSATESIQPNMLPAMKEHLVKNRNDKVKDDKELAKMVLAASEGKVT